MIQLIKNKIHGYITTIVKDVVYEELYAEKKWSAQEGGKFTIKSQNDSVIHSNIGDVPAFRYKELGGEWSSWIGKPKGYKAENE